MAAQAAIANNIANASTIGFRADRVVFDRLMLKRRRRLEARAPTVGGSDRRRSHARARSSRPAAPLDVAMTGDSVAGGAGGGRHRSLYAARRPGGRALGRAADRRRLPGAWGRGARSPCRPTNRSRSPPTARSRSCPQGGDANAAAGDRPAQAGQHQGHRDRQGPRQSAPRHGRRHAARRSRRQGRARARSKDRTST